MWSWNGGEVFLFVLACVCVVVVAASSGRFVRSRLRAQWPLSSPQHTRRPGLVLTTTAMAAACIALHTAKQIADKDMPCALYVLLFGGLVQGLCIVFEIRLYSLLFLFECTDNLCNMNEHRKQRAALMLEHEREKRENQGALGLQLQSPPHSQVRLPVKQKQQTPPTPEGKFTVPATRRLEVQPALSPSANATEGLPAAPLQLVVTAPNARRSLQPNNPPSPIARNTTTTTPDPAQPTGTKVASWVTRRPTDAHAAPDSSPAGTPARHASPSPRATTAQNNFFERAGSRRRGATAKNAAAPDSARPKSDRGDVYDNGVAVMVDEDERRANRSRSGDGENNSQEVAISDLAKQLSVVRIYTPSWFVSHRGLMKASFLWGWALCWNALLYAVLLVLLFTEPADSNRMRSNAAVDNLECNVRHTSGLQFVWALVGVHLVFLLCGVARLARFPMDGFRVKQELHVVLALAAPALILHLALPNSVEARLHHSSTPPQGGQVLGVDGGGVFASLDQSSQFPVDLLFSIFLPFLLSLAVTELPLVSVEPGDATTDLLGTEVVTGLEELLATKHGFASFFNFLKTEFTMQNLLYWRACKNFQAAIDDHRLVRHTNDSITGDLLAQGADPLADGILSGLASAGSSEHDPSRHARGLNLHAGAHSPRNSVLSLSVGNVGLKVQRAPAVLYANPAHASLLQPATPLSSSKPRNMRQMPAGVLENATALPHPPRNANLPPGAISPSVNSNNSRGPAGLVGGAAYLVAYPPNTSLLRQPARTAEGSVVSLGSPFLQMRSPTVGARTPGEALSPEAAQAELVDPRLRIARLQRQAAAQAMEHTRIHAMKLLEKARSIHDRFVRDGAAYEVRDIPGPLRQRILEFMSLLLAGFKSPVDQVADIAKIFVDSQDFVYDLLSTDAFPRYLRSPFFAKFKANARARAALQQVRIQKVARERQMVAMREAAGSPSAQPSRLRMPAADHTLALVSGGRFAHGLGFSHVNSAAAVAGHLVASAVTNNLPLPAPSPHAGMALGANGGSLPVSDDERELELAHEAHGMSGPLSQSLRGTSPVFSEYASHFGDIASPRADQTTDRPTLAPAGSLDRAGSLSSRDEGDRERDCGGDGGGFGEDSPSIPAVQANTPQSFAHAALPPAHKHVRSLAPLPSPAPTASRTLALASIDLPDSHTRGRSLELAPLASTVSPPTATPEARPEEQRL